MEVYEYEKKDSMPASQYAVVDGQIIRNWSNEYTKFTVSVIEQFAVNSRSKVLIYTLPFVFFWIRVEDNSTCLVWFHFIIR